MPSSLAPARPGRESSTPIAQWLSDRKKEKYHEIPCFMDLTLHLDATLGLCKPAGSKITEVNCIFVYIRVAKRRSSATLKFLTPDLTRPLIHTLPAHKARSHGDVLAVVETSSNKPPNLSQQITSKQSSSASLSSVTSSSVDSCVWQTPS